MNTTNKNSKTKEIQRPILRFFAISTAITAVGNGVFTATSFLFYTQAAGLGPQLTGTALTVTGVIAVGLGLLIGRCLERVHPVVLNAAILLVQSVAVAAIAVVAPIIPLLLLMGSVAVATQVKRAARGALIGRMVENSQRVRARATIRTVSNIAIGVGGGLAAAVTATDTAIAYRFGLIFVAVTYFLGVIPLWYIRPESLYQFAVNYSSDSSEVDQKRSAIHDARYTYVAVVSGLLSIHFLLIEVGLPQWTNSLDRALWIVPLALIINTLVVAFGQIPLSRMVTSVRQAVCAIILGGACFLISCMALAFSGQFQSSWMITIVATAVATYSVGEILHSAGSWELSFSLAKQNQMLEYQSVFFGAQSLGTVVAPLAITSILAEWSNSGWTVMGICFFLLAILLIPTSRTKQRMS
ncbi:MFS transporter [Actinopolyspora sp. H202]|uniref:MFS transporter n=1 Tax=Actinopolyspora sp. H202 TaxID=1500456 RepID=UPI003EE4EA3C